MTETTKTSSVADAGSPAQSGIAAKAGRIAGTSPAAKSGYKPAKIAVNSSGIEKKGE
jgi:hypothetical protein